MRIHNSLLFKLLSLLMVGGGGAFLPIWAAERPTTLERLESTIDAQQQQIDALEQKIEATGEILEATAIRGAAARGATQTTSIGGYGELHYNRLSNDGPAGDLTEIDFHRFVLFIGHDFSDRVRFHSELELEHALTEDTADGSGPGEVELEQAFIDFELDRRLVARAGLFLVPVGLLNETHEPTTFYGVERNPVEKEIIPTTWWEAGAGLYGELAPGWAYDIAVTSGLKVGTDYKVRGGRQKAAKAQADALAYTGRVKWTGVPGIELAATAQYQEDITQEIDPTAGSATLLETHAVVSRGPFSVKLLYATWSLDAAGPKAVGADEQTGWYIEPAYAFSSAFGVFARFSLWDNAAGDSIDSEFTQSDVGVNYWPHEDVVVKLDYQVQDGAVGANLYDGLNLAIGYQF